ncbi:predicted protein [Arabidopsis lyrata subsp. lyrata]|uniref:Predicted protein n=1 Tax=Arabidopsis lyrata subsp. lyrata TaxID=81972 RepID=D7MTQ4_ARALL|nr:predicted protein [Arabidopsis lyrata subsp. lyrata]
MNIIPHPLLLDIVRRLSQHGFRELGALIASGPEFMALVFDASVLKDVDIDEFVFVTQLCNEDSVFRPFFLRCLDSGNPAAQFVEGLRLAVAEGPSERSVELLCEAYVDSSFDTGMHVMEQFFSLLRNMEEAVDIAEMVLTQTAGFRLPRAGRFNNSFRFGGGLPHCFLNNYSVLHLCRRCFVYMYAIRFQELC